MNIVKKLLGKSKESSDNNDSSSIIIIEEDPLFTFEEYKYPTPDLLKQRNDDKKQGVIPMYSILSSKEYQDTPFNLPCAMGLTITGELFIFDLARVPHLFIEGAKGPTRDSALDVIITSLIYKKHPAELKLVFIDQTGDHFLPYQNLYNLFLATFEFMSLEQKEESKIIKNPYDIINAFKSLLMLTNKRYNLFMDVKARNIKEFNQKFREGEISYSYMPHIVVVIDDLGSIMRKCSIDILPILTRLVLFSRAAGIHLIMTSEKSYMDGVLTRIKLSGGNDMIYYSDGVCLETPFQCASIEKDEIEQLLKFFKGQRNYKSYYCLPFDMSTYIEPEVMDETEKKDNTDMTYYLDPLFADAAKVIVQQQNSSLLFLQHQFALGYHRTSRLMDQLYNAGIVGPDNGEKPRSVLISSEEELDKILMKYQISPNPIIYPFKCQTNLDKRSDHHDFLKE